MSRSDFNITYTDLPDGLYTLYQPQTAPDPNTLLLNHDLAGELGVDADWLDSSDALGFFSGRQSADTNPIAMAYAGHQFGGFSPQLGDGRAALIGEFVDGEGIRHDIHLKGSGRTVYSRGGDGKATLRAVLKEYMFSESLAALGIPATRSLAALTTGEPVMRQKQHPGAILVRTAKSHIRVGTFQYARLMQDETALKALADFTIKRLYPDIDAANPYVILLEQAIDKQAKLVAKWMTFGFIHGVMNTDNMAISGETIDFGPCAFMETFRADQVFSSIDHYGRYAWNKQPEMALWNLTRFAEALLPLLHTDETQAVTMAQTVLSQFSGIFSRSFNTAMLAKLGLRADIEGAEMFLGQTMTLLSEQGLDFTLFFRCLTDIAGGKTRQPFLALFSDRVVGKKWLESWQKLTGDTDEIASLMRLLNPVYIPRFAQLETALEAAEKGDLQPVQHMLSAVTDPFEEKPCFTDLAKQLSDTSRAQQTFCET